MSLNHLVNASDTNRLAIYPANIYLPTSGGTPSALNSYEAGTFSLTTSGAWVASWTVYVTKVGQNVTFLFPGDVSSKATAASPLLVTAQIPARFRPSLPVYGLLYGVSNGSNATLSYIVNNDGSMSIGASATSTAANFTAATATNGPNAWCISFHSTV